MFNILIGSVIGFVVSFLLIKRQIKHDGAGQLKCCQSCPYFVKQDDVKQDEDGLNG